MRENTLTPSDFNQFTLTPVSVEIAEALAGSWTRLLELTRNVKGFSQEVKVLSTGAKLYWVAQSERSFGNKALYTFAIASYHYDGGDGWKAYETALATTHNMSTVSYARSTNKCAECGTWFNDGFIADVIEGDNVVDMVYVCSVKCGLDSRQPF